MFFSFFFISTFLLPSCNTPKTVTASAPEEEHKYEIYFEKSETLMPVLDKVKKGEKLIFITFYTDWCLPCKLMEEDVFTDAEIGRFFNKNFLNMHVNGETTAGANLVSIFQVKVYPTILFLDQAGNVIVRKDGAAFHSELRGMADEALRGGSPN